MAYANKITNFGYLGPNLFFSVLFHNGNVQQLNRNKNHCIFVSNFFYYQLHTKKSDILKKIAIDDSAQLP